MELGLEYGIIASVVVLLLQISKLDMDSIGQLRTTDDVEGGGDMAMRKEDMQFRPLDNYPSARQHPEIKVGGFSRAVVYRGWMGGWLGGRAQ